MKSKLAIALILPGFFLISCAPKIPQLRRVTATELDYKPLNFEYLKGKGKINYQDDSIQLSATANVRIKKDSAIWISFTKNIELARGIITQDSIVFLDRWHKVYYVYDYDDLSQKFNFKIDYRLIESMIIGELTMSLDESEKVSEEGNFFRVRQVNGNVVIDNYISRTIMKVERVEMIEVPTKNSLSLNYTDFQMVDNIPFPFSGIVFLNYVNSNEQFTTKIAFNFDKAEFLDRDLKLPFNIPEKYDRQ